MPRPRRQTGPSAYPLRVPLFKQRFALRAVFCRTLFYLSAKVNVAQSGIIQRGILRYEEVFARTGSTLLLCSSLCGAGAGGCCRSSASPPSPSSQASSRPPTRTVSSVPVANELGMVLVRRVRELAELVFTIRRFAPQGVVASGYSPVARGMLLNSRSMLRGCGQYSKGMKLVEVIAEWQHEALSLPPLTGTDRLPETSFGHVILLRTRHSGDQPVLGMPFSKRMPNQGACKTLLG